MLKQKVHLSSDPKMCLAYFYFRQMLFASLSWKFTMSTKSYLYTPVHLTTYSNSSLNSKYSSNSCFKEIKKDKHMALKWRLKEHITESSQVLWCHQKVSVKFLGYRLKCQIRVEQQTDNQTFCERFKSEQLIFYLLNKKNGFGFLVKRENKGDLFSLRAWC